MTTKALSIITINKNNATGLEKTIQSVCAQTSADFEYIVIDGSSDDGSVEVIKKYTGRIDYWVSEPDMGIYNAMNKGIRKAQGNYCLFLNSGDCLVSPETLVNVLKEIKGNPADIFYSDLLKPDCSIHSYPRVLSVNFFIQTTINHQNTLIKRSLFLEHGFYNENLEIFSDWEFFLNEMWKHKSIFHYIKTNISFYDTYGISSTSTLKRQNEIMTVCKNVFNELADTIIEYKNFRATIYYNIMTNNYDTKLLTFCLRVYRRILKLIRGWSL